ncbi:MAG: hypothetical protein WAV20_19515 [Blastocatellia bacterium]
MIRHRINLPPVAQKLIEEFMPICDATEFHQTTVRASIQTVYETLRTADLGGSPVVRLLLRLRQLPTLFFGGRSRSMPLNFDALVRGGFILLGENPPNEIALGIVGRFWTMSGSRCRLTAGEFRQFNQPGYARAVWNFSLVEEGAQVTRLATETRVQCLDDSSRRRFRVYWSVIAPFSGLIRREVLRTIRKRAEL